MSPCLSIDQLSILFLNISLRKHADTHRHCPKEDCDWKDAGSQKDMIRHIWCRHKAWAKINGYPSLEASCDECLAVFARQDGVSRHKKEVHGATKRARKLGG